MYLQKPTSNGSCLVPFLSLLHRPPPFSVFHFLCFHSRSLPPLISASVGTSPRSGRGCVGAWPCPAVQRWRARRGLRAVCAREGFRREQWEGRLLCFCNCPRRVGEHSVGVMRLKPLEPPAPGSAAARPCFDHPRPAHISLALGFKPTGAGRGQAGPRAGR